MGLGFPPEGWAIVAATTGFCGWVLGEMRGAARTCISALHENSSEKSLFSTTIDDVSRLERDRPLRPVRTKSGARRELFADMPPITELREQARHILLTDTVRGSAEFSEFLSHPDHDSMRLLVQYSASINELKRVNKSRVEDQADPEKRRSITDLRPFASEKGAPLSPDYPLVQRLSEKGMLDQRVPMARPRYIGCGRIR